MQVLEEGLREYLPWLKPGPGVFKGGGARVVVHKISDSLGGVLHLPARGQGVLLDHPATGRGQWARSQPEGPRPGDETDTPPSQPVDLKPWTLKLKKFTGAGGVNLLWSQRLVWLVLQTAGDHNKVTCSKRVILNSSFHPRRSLCLSCIIITESHNISLSEKISSLVIFEKTLNSAVLKLFPDSLLPSGWKKYAICCTIKWF